MCGFRRSCVASATEVSSQLRSVIANSVCSVVGERPTDAVHLLEILAVIAEAKQRRG